jgi:hypothetical protein
MACRNICLRSYSKMVVGQSHYSAGKKYCRRCECYFITLQMFCECCGMQLRASPHCGRVYKEKVRAKKKLVAVESILDYQFSHNTSIIRHERGDDCLQEMVFCGIMDLSMVTDIYRCNCT